MPTTEFPNLWSRVLLQRAFEEQFYVPKPPHFLERIALGALETLLRPGQLEAIPITKPIFIVGLPRSGTSLLYDLLTAHEDAVFPNHLVVKYHMAPIAIERLRSITGLGFKGPRFLQDSVDVTLNGAAEPFTQWGKWFGRDLDSLYWAPLSRASLGEERLKATYRDIRSLIYAYDRKTPRFICKFAVSQPEIPLLREIFPDARFINIIRDGRATAHSLIKLHRLSNAQLGRIRHPLLREIIPYPRVARLREYVERFGPDTIQCTARVWRDGMALFDEYRPQLGSQYHELYYEELVADPTGTLEELWQFCEMSVPTPARYAELVSGIGKLKHANLYDDADVAERICAPMLRQHGYLS